MPGYPKNRISSTLLVKLISQALRSNDTECKSIAYAIERFAEERDLNLQQFEEIIINTKAENISSKSCLIRNIYIVSNDTILSDIVIWLKYGFTASIEIVPLTEDFSVYSLFEVKGEPIIDQFTQ